jgi:hypothetical protein
MCDRCPSQAPSAPPGSEALDSDERRNGEQGDQARNRSTTGWPTNAWCPIGARAACATERQSGATAPARDDGLVEYRRRVSEWFDEKVAGPIRELLQTMPVGDALEDLNRCDVLGLGIDWLFRKEVEAQYAGWPPGSTTGGTLIEFCVRPSADTIDVAGLTWIDFAATVFPSRAELRLRRNGAIAVTAYIGQTDPDTGAPPRFPRDKALVVPTRDSTDPLPRPELILGRRQVPIVWTKAFEVG